MKNIQPADGTKTVTQAEFARVMQVSKVSVTKWKARGWLVMVDGMVDVEASWEILRQNRVAPPGLDTPFPRRRT